MRARLALPLVLVLAVFAAGCVSDPAGSPTETVTPVETVDPLSETPESPSPTDPSVGATTPPPNRTVEFPDGPKERPERPDPLDATAVGEFVKTHEYRYAYNSLWYGEHTDVSLECELLDVTERESWYEVRVSCTGSSNTGGDAEGTETATVVHADWFTQEFVYLVDENSLVRERVERGA